MTESAVSERKRVGFSFGRIATIAANTFTEALRQKIFNVLLLAGLVLIASGLFFRQFTMGDQIKNVKDAGLAWMVFFGSLIAIVATAQMVPNELENRTLYTLLAKPVRRAEFLLGKYLGSLMLLMVTVLLMSLMFAAELMILERSAIRELRFRGPDSEEVTLEQAEQEVREQIRDVNMVKAIALTLVKTALLAAMTLLFSTFSTSLVFNITMGFSAWIAGTLVDPAREVLAAHKFLLMLLAIIPDLSAFNVYEEVVENLVVTWSHVGSVAVYGLGRIALVLVASCLIFSQREI